MTTTRVRIVHVSDVRPNSASSPLLDRVKLSLFDTPWLRFHPNQRLLLFSSADLPPYSAVVASLKASLSRTLSLYYPLAGKLVYVPSTGDAEIDCSADGPGVGVAFVEAEAVDVDARRLAGEEVHDVEAFLQLVPDLDTGELPAPLFAVQVTRLGGGGGGGGGEGVAVGFAAHHAVADGRAIWRFVEAWAAACRGESGPPPPTVERAVIRHPRAEEIARQFLHQRAPNLPKVEVMKVPLENLLRLTRRTFVVSPKSIQLLKQRATPCTEPPSTFVAISAHAWIALVRSMGFKHDDEAYLLVPADCRARIDPPVNEGYFGNCIIPLFPKAKVRDLLGEDGHLAACAAIQKAIHESLDHNPLEDCESWMDKSKGVVWSRLGSVAASPRFKVYEIDFGWGQPSRVELVSMSRNGELAFAAARDGAGVQLSVALDPLHMEAFAQYFLDGLSDQDSA